jgi:uncharacterized protein YdaU (DUF1376 family)
MADLHYFPMYASDWLAGEATTLMTCEQEGAFLRLLLHAWLTKDVCPCSIPADDTKLAAMSKMGRKWLTSGVFVRAQFEPVEDYPDRLRNARLWTIYVEQTEKHSRRVMAGALGGHARAKRKQSSSNATAMLKQSPSKRLAKSKQSESESDTEIQTTEKQELSDAHASVPRVVRSSELLPFEDCESLRQKWESTGRTCEYPRFRKALKPLFVPMKRYSVEQLSKAIDAFDELAKQDGPMKSTFWNLTRFVENIGVYVDWAAMPAVDGSGNLTQRGKLAMQGAA